MESYRLYKRIERKYKARKHVKFIAGELLASMGIIILLLINAFMAGM